MFPSTARFFWPQHISLASKLQFCTHAISSQPDTCSPVLKHVTGFPSNTSRQGWGTDKLHVVKARIESRYLSHIKGHHLFRDPFQTADFLRARKGARDRNLQEVATVPEEVDLREEQMIWVCASFHRFGSRRILEICGGSDEGSKGSDHARPCITGFSFVRHCLGFRDGDQGQDQWPMPEISRADLRGSMPAAGSAPWRKLGANDMLIFSLYNQTERMQWDDAFAFASQVLPVMEQGSLVCILGLHYPHYKRFGPGQSVIKASLQHSNMYTVLHISNGVALLQRTPHRSRNHGLPAAAPAGLATIFDDQGEDDIWKSLSRENIVITCGGHDSIGSATTVIKSLATNIVGDTTHVHIYLVTSQKDWEDIKEFRDSIQRRYRNIHLHFLDIAPEVYLAERLVNLTHFNHTHPSGIWGFSKMLLPDRMAKEGVSNFMLLDDDILLLGTIHEFLKATREAMVKHDQTGGRQEGWGSFMAMGCLHDPVRIDQYCTRHHRPHNCHPTDYCSSAPWYFDLDRFRKAKYSLKELLPDATNEAAYVQAMSGSLDPGRTQVEGSSFGELIWYVTKDMVREYPAAVYEVSDQEVINRVHRLSPGWTAAMPCEWLCFKGQGRRPAGGCHERCRLLHYASDSFYDKDHFWGFSGLWTKHQSKSPLPFTIPGITSGEPSKYVSRSAKTAKAREMNKLASLPASDQELERRINALSAMNRHAGDNQQSERNFLDSLITPK